MEELGGYDSLRHYLTLPLNKDELIRICMEVLRVIAEAHSKYTYHNNLSLDSILIRRKGSRLATMMYARGIESEVDEYQVRIVNWNEATTFIDKAGYPTQNQLTSTYINKAIQPELFRRE